VIVSVAGAVAANPRGAWRADAFDPGREDIDQMVTGSASRFLKVGGVASAVMIVMSLLLASTIAGTGYAGSPTSAERRPPPYPHPASRSPDFTRRRDEIGHLSGAAARHDRRAL